MILISVISMVMNGSDPDDQPVTAFTIADLEYDLPEERIAQHPPAHRDDARLLVVDRMSGAFSDRTMNDLPELLRPGDVLVLNDTRVIPAKFLSLRQTGGKVRGLFICEEKPATWFVMLEGSHRLREGETLHVAAAEDFDLSLILQQSCGGGHWWVRVSADGTAESILDRIGQTPLPPYIRRKNGQPQADRIDRSRYQTIYAENPGSIAAPTAGLHFTDKLLERIRHGGVEIVYLTLHVGEGTFKRISADTLSRHVMHNERYNLPQETASAIHRGRTKGGRVVAVGTTSVRVLESLADENGIVKSRSGRTELLIYPPYRYRAVDALLTNFHLPRSTLLALVMAFAGIETIRQAYRHALEQKYRFYSYGDAMFIHS